MAVRRWIVVAIVAVLGGLGAVFGAVQLFDVLYYRHYKLPGASMEPAIHAGASIWSRPVDRRHVVHGEIVLLKPPANAFVADTVVVRRVVGVGGETVQVVGGQLTVNGTAVREPYVHAGGAYALPGPKTTIPAGSVYVLGDYRSNSLDSREYGPVPLGNISQRVVNTDGASGVALIVRSLLLPVGVGLIAISVVLVVRGRRRAGIPPEPPSSDK